MVLILPLWMKHLNASCLHWSVFGQQRETGLYLFFDLGCSIEVRNRFKQTPRELFANANEVWDFLIPNAYKTDRLIEAFQKVIQTECRHKAIRHRKSMFTIAELESIF